VITNEVRAGWRHERSEPAQQLAALEHQHVGAVVQGPLQAIGEPSIGELREATMRKRRTGTVPARVREAFPIVSMQVHSRI